MGRYYKDAKTMARAETHAYVRDLYARTRRHVNKLVEAGRLDPADADAEWRRRVREALEAAGIPVPQDLKE